jgi:hypothetical protein
VSGDHFLAMQLGDNPQHHLSLFFIFYVFIINSIKI